MADALGLPMMIDAPIGDCDLVHAIGLDNPPAEDWVLRCTSRAQRRVFWWDERAARLLFEPERLVGDSHVCSFEGTRSLLLGKGIDPMLIPLPVTADLSSTALPSARAVLGVAQQDPFTSCFEVLASVKVALEAKGIPMSIVKDPDPASPEFIRLIGTHRVLVNLTVAESDWILARLFMQAGRRCIVNRPLSHATVVPEWDLPGLLRAIDEALSHDEPDERASEHWTKENSVKTFLSRIEEEL